MSSRVQRGLLGCSIIAIVLSTSMAIVITTSQPVQIAWHKWRMVRAYEAHLAQPGQEHGELVGRRIADDYRRYEEHRDRLVELGAASKREYTFRCITSPTPESKHLLRQLFVDVPPVIHWEADYPEPPGPQGLDVWCWTEDTTAWDKYVTDRDIPDYRERYIDGPGRY